MKLASGTVATDVNGNLLSVCIEYRLNNLHVRAYKINTCGSDMYSIRVRVGR
jgi:hypothetical protein